MKLGFSLAVGMESADGKASDWRSVCGEDVGQCIQKIAIPIAELVVIEEVNGGGVP